MFYLPLLANTYVNFVVIKGGVPQVVIFETWFSDFQNGNKK